jgi:hypothetical protein
MSKQAVTRVTRKGEQDHGCQVRKRTSLRRDRRPRLSGRAKPALLFACSATNNVIAITVRGQPNWSSADPGLRGIRFEDHPLAGPSIHDHGQRRVKAQMADAAVFLHRRRIRKPLPIDEAFAGVGIDGEVADLESG